METMEKVVYLDNAATTACAPEVLAVMTQALSGACGNPSSHYSVGYEAKEFVDTGRAQVAKAINASPAEIFFTGCGSEADNWAVKGTAFTKARQNKKHLITSAFEHHAIMHSMAALERMGFEVTYIKPTPEGYIRPEDVEAAIRPDTALVSIMMANNEIGTIQPIKEIAEIAHKHGVPLIVDNTFPTPINCRPFEWGADIVVHSTTKYMDGHATSVGGAIVDSGNFDWDAHADKFPGLCTPDESYHGLTYTKAFGKLAYITKATAQLMRDLGSIQSPQNAFLLNLGLETLHLRMPQHCGNAQKVAEYLSRNEKVAWVNYCGLPDNKYYELAQKYMPNGSCGVISFGLKGGREVSIKFMDSLKLAAIVTHVADARTCVLHPASHTHRQLSDEQLLEAGIRPDLIRFSVGIENAEDIIADIEQALNA